MNIVEIYILNCESSTPKRRPLCRMLSKTNAGLDKIGEDVERFRKAALRIEGRLK